MRQFLSTLGLSLIFLGVFAQSGVIKGRVFDPISNQGVPFANIIIQGTSKGASAGIEGEFEITGLESKLYNVDVSAIGYEKKTVFEIQVYPNKPVYLDVALKENSQLLEAVEIVASPFSKKVEAPVSMRTIGVSEIERNPGGNRDISRVIQTLPGVASSPSFRNDIIIRGGAPNENRFYLDGVEVPNINHFATQGSSGGPVGLINVNFIKEVEFFSGAFPADRGNALSSVFEFYQKEGNPDDIKANITVGSSDYGLTLDGPLGEKSNFVFSVRRSYLQLLFSALRLPFLPIYNDSQFKITYDLTPKDQIKLIGLGAFDQFELNEGANDGVTDEATLERNRYILGNIASNDQWNYTVGAVYKHFNENSFEEIVISRNHLNNTAVKYQDNDESLESNKILDYESQEIENKLRMSHTWRKDGWKVNIGLGAEQATYTNSTFNRIVDTKGRFQTIDFESRLNMLKGSVFTQVSKSLLNSKLQVSGGIRTDFNDYNSDMGNPLNQLSPRVSASYNFLPQWSLNANVGRYFQLPAYTVLGFRNNAGTLVNQQNGVTYIQSDHLVLGVEWLPSSNAKISLEGFTKFYSNYPLLLRDSISLANLGSDFGVIGNEPAVSTSEGLSYGLELLLQQKLSNGYYGIASFTLVRSLFEDKNGELIPSAWDNRGFFTLTGGKKLKKNWELGVRFRWLGGAPYTPFDFALSADQQTWDIRGIGVLDLNRLNQERNRALNQLDVRIDKRWFFEKWSLNAYLDIQNLYNAQAELAPFFTVERDEDGMPLENPNNPTAYQGKLVQNFSGNVLPSIGLIIEF